MVLYQLTDSSLEEELPRTPRFGYIFDAINLRSRIFISTLTRGELPRPTAGIAPRIEISTGYIQAVGEKLGNYKLVRHLRETIKASPHRHG